MNYFDRLLNEAAVDVCGHPEDEFCATHGNRRPCADCEDGLLCIGITPESIKRRAKVVTVPDGWEPPF